MFIKIRNDVLKFILGSALIGLLLYLAKTANSENEVEFKKQSIRGVILKVFKKTGDKIYTFTLSPDSVAYKLPYYLPIIS